MISLEALYDVDWTSSRGRWPVSSRTHELKVESISIYKGLHSMSFDSNVTGRFVPYVGQDPVLKSATSLTV